MKKKLSMAAVGLTIFMAGLFGGVAIADQPHMQNAMDALNTAMDELNRAEPNKGGHRERAIGLVQQAIDQVEMGIAAGRRNE